jgi:hypothetical protein
LVQGATSTSKLDKLFQRACGIQFKLFGLIAGFHGGWRGVDLDGKGTLPNRQPGGDVTPRRDTTLKLIDFHGILSQLTTTLYTKM